MPTLVDGHEVDVIAVSDSAVLRGDGCFEVVRSYGGRLFALGWHLDRLERSAAMMDLETPDRARLEEWCCDVASSGDGLVRILLTRGDPGCRGRCVVMSVGLPTPADTVRLQPVGAPWHPAGRASELAGAKTLSYAPNLAATRSAVARGFDDAILISDRGVVLEGPTFSIAWVIDDVIETPAVDLFILDSITRRTMIELSHRDRLEVVEVHETLERLVQADEVMAMSTVKQIVPVTAVGDVGFDPGPVTRRLMSRFADAVSQRWGE